MTKLVKKYNTFIKLFSYLNKNRQKLIFSLPTREFIDLVGECCFNYCRLVKKKKSSNKHTSIINQLKDRENSYANKKELIKQKGSGFLPFLFKAVAPIVASLF